MAGPEHGPDQLKAIFIFKAVIGLHALFRRLQGQVKTFGLAKMIHCQQVARSKRAFFDHISKRGPAPDGHQVPLQGVGNIQAFKQPVDQGGILKAYPGRHIQKGGQHDHSFGV